MFPRSIIMMELINVYYIIVMLPKQKYDTCVELKSVLYRSYQNSIYTVSAINIRFTVTLMMETF